VRSRQLAGRIVAVSNKLTCTQPVFNYSAGFEYVWEEMVVPIPHDGDWRRAETVLREEVRRVSASEGPREAIAALADRFPMPRAELEPRVFVRATDDWMELAARFVVPVRSALLVKDEMTRRVRLRFDEEGIAIASRTMEVTPRRHGASAEGDRGPADGGGAPDRS
jgi:small-conductance mechanosensitive channel